MTKIVLEAFFLDPLHADEAMSNLLEAEYSPVQSKNGQSTEVTLEVAEETAGNAREILQTFQPEKINEVKEKKRK